MTSSVFRAAKSCLSLNQTVKLLQQRFYASFTLREVLNERSDETGTLLLRFAKHLATEGRKNAPLVSTTVRYSDYYPVTNLQHFQHQLNGTKPEQLPAVVIFAFSYRPSADPSKYAEVLNKIDAKAMQHVDEMDADTILNTMYALLFLMPNWLTRMDFYGAAMEKLVSHDFGNTATARENFVQLCFYLGLNKKRVNSQNILLKTLMERQLDKYLPELTTMDLAIISNAAYKTSTLIQNEAYNQRLCEEVMAMPLDRDSDALLITFLKAMRHQRVKSSAVCEHLSSLCSSEANVSQLQPAGLVHILGYFSAQLWDKPDATRVLVKEFLQRLPLRKIELSKVRAKDIATFVWSCAQLNCALTPSDLQLIESTVQRKVQNDEYQYFPDHLVDCCLYLWSLGYKSHTLLEDAENLKSQVFNNKRQQPKVDSRYTVLLTAVAIEEPNWLRGSKKEKSINITDKPPAYLLKSRTDLQQYAAQVAKEPGVAEVKLICPIDGINIPSLIVHFEDSEAPIFVELLTDEQILHFSQVPVALMRLKMRLLGSTGHKVIALRPRDLVEDYTSLKDVAFEDDAVDSPEKESLRGM